MASNKDRYQSSCEVADGGFVCHEYYPDESTVSLVVAASEVSVGLAIDQVFNAFGQLVVEFTR